MRRQNKKMTTYFILLAILLIGVVYAFLQANLQINGTAKIQANTWDIHFDNIQVNENSVAIGTGDTQATIDSEDNCKVDFEVTLSIPGDFYEFTIDVVNAGTIDGMIGELNKTLKVNNEVVEEVPEYLNYSVTYSDGNNIEENHKITAGTTETYLVRLEFKTDIEELPSAKTISTSLTPQFIQADSSAKYRPHSLYNVLKTQAEIGILAQEYTGEHKDSFTINGTEKIYYWYAISNVSANEKVNLILDSWNVLFGGFCWQMYRTTDTGGIKLIYNGIPNDGKCNNTGAYQQIGISAFNSSYDSPVYAGYMYNTDYLISEKGSTAAEEGSLYGNSYNYNNGYFTLVDTATTLDSTHHYTCNNTTGICENVRYYYSINNYYVLNNDINIEQTVRNMLSADNVNQTDSTMKQYIERWFSNNLISNTNKLEDVVFCNDRSIIDIETWGFNPNGGTILSTPIKFRGYSADNNLNCANITDQFSVGNIKAHLNYPIGLITLNEIMLLNNVQLTRTGEKYWLYTPRLVEGNSPMVNYVSTGGTNSDKTFRSMGVRPVVSLKPGTTYGQGDGSKDNPYIIE